MADEELTDDVPTFNIGSLISEKISDSIKNMDLVAMIEKMVESTPEEEESEAVRQRLLGVLETYKSLSDEDKATMQAQMKELLASKLSDRMKDYTIDTTELQEAISDAIFWLYCYIAAAVILVILFVFFGYKLYKSIKEKEKKREEKRKAKMSKKKK